MLQQFSWLQFGLTMALLALIWYIAVGWLYFRREAQALFKQETPEDFLIGEAAEDSIRRIDPEEMEFADEEESAVAGPDPKVERLGLVSDCLKEVDGFLVTIANEPKDQISRLLGLLAPSLAPLEGTEHKAAVTQHIREEVKRRFDLELDEKVIWPKKLNKGVAVTVLTLLGLNAMAQDGNQGIQQATTMVKSYFDTGCNLMYAVGAVVGIIGAIKVFQKWNAGEPDTNKVAAAWFGSCIFLVVVSMVIKSFFGL